MVSFSFDFFNDSWLFLLHHDFVRILLCLGLKFPPKTSQKLHLFLCFLAFLDQKMERILLNLLWSFARNISLDDFHNFNLEFLYLFLNRPPTSHWKSSVSSPRHKDRIVQFPNGSVCETATRSSITPSDVTGAVASWTCKFSQINNVHFSSIFFKN